MPDWTYHPLRGAAAMVLGVDRSRRAALRALATIEGIPGIGGLVLRGFGLRASPPAMAGSVAGVDVSSRLGAIVPPRVARDAIRALPALGAGFVVVMPVSMADVATVHRAGANRRCPVLVGARSAQEGAVTAALSPHVDGFVTAHDPAFIRVATPSIACAANALLDRNMAVMVTPGVLVSAGPGWFARVAEEVTQAGPVPSVRAAGLHPRSWPAWWWGVLAGIGMICAGLGAMAITLGPVLLGYDRSFLGMDRTGLQGINGDLVHFLQHDRITMAGTTIAVGVLYIGLSYGGIRRGWPWAREAFIASGVVGFPTLFYFLGTGFIEPLHIAATAVLLPVFVLATRRKGLHESWTVMTEGPEHVRRRALLGQLLVIVTGVGLFIGGAAVSVVGLTDVFVATDLEFLRTSAASLQSANPRLLAFIAHDRAGFGGSLMAAATAIILLTAWGWRRGESWVWWTLLCAAIAGFGPVVAVHASIGYTAFLHLAPVYLGIALTVLGLILARSYLCAQPMDRERSYAALHDRRR